MKLDEARKRQAVKISNLSGDDLSGSVDTSMSGGEKKNNFFKKGLTSLKGLLSSK